MQWRGFVAGSDPTGLTPFGEGQGQFGFMVGKATMVFAGAGRVLRGAGGAGAFDEAAATLRWGDEVFGAAQAGGRHAGFLEAYAGRSASEIAKAQRSLGGRIAEHEGFLANPAGHVQNWAHLSGAHQQRLISHWRTEIRTAHEQIQILGRIQ
jgi:hypothetical protein